MTLLVDGGSGGGANNRRLTGGIYVGILLLTMMSITVTLLNAVSNEHEQ